jgi:hypothetical protein
MSGVVQVLGMLAAAGLAAAAVLAADVRVRAGAMLAALVLTPVLLVAEIWDTPQLEAVRDRGAFAAALLAGGLLAVAGLALLIRRRPALLAYLALAALPFRVPIESGGATANLLVPLYAVIAAGVLAHAVPRLRGEPARDTLPRNGALEWLLLGSVVLYAVQSAYSSDKAVALQQVVFFYVPFALLFALLREVPWREQVLLRAFAVLAGLAVLFVAIGFWEFSARELLLNPKVISNNQVAPYFRVNSLFFDPNIYGRFLAIVMLGLAAILLWTRRPRSTALLAVLLTALWAGLVLTLSQSSFAGLLAGLAVLAVLRFAPRWTLAVGTAGVVAGMALLLLAPGVFGLDRGLDEASSGRASLVGGGVRLATDRPIAGWGAGAFSEQYRKREAASRQRAVSASHTIPITVAAEQGLIGLAVYLALLAAALARLLRGARGMPARAAVAAAFVAVVVHTWLYAAFLEDPITWTLLALGVALARVPDPDRAGWQAAQHG